jgi:carboxyl-terminal processing protease
VPEILQGIAAGTQAAPAPPDLAALSESEAWPAFKPWAEAAASAPGQRLSLDELLETGLKAFCRTLDPWSKYYTTTEFARIQRSSGTGRGTIGVNVREVADGSFYLYPLPGGPAGFAGVQPGDRLLSVDGQKPDGRPVELVAAWIGGAPGSTTNLRVERRGGRSEYITVHREELTPQPFHIEKDLAGLTVRIRYFDRGLAEKLEQELKPVTGLRSLTIDLRGCIGGSMLSAIQCADLFLPVGKRIASLAERGRPVQHFDSTREPLALPRSVSLLQDQGTASAAELFIAALVENLPAQVGSAGEPSYGKGVVQLEQELAGGGKLVLTTGILFGPGGKSWNEVGLLPSVASAGKIFPAEAVSIDAPAAKPKSRVRLVE